MTEQIDHDDVRKELEGAAEAEDVSDAIAKAAGNWIRRYEEFGSWYDRVADKPGGVTEEWQMNDVLGPAFALEESACRALRAYRVTSADQKQAAEAAVLDAIANCNGYYVKRMNRGVPNE